MEPAGLRLASAAAPIVCGIDDAYVLPWQTLAASIAAAHPVVATRPRMIVLHAGLSGSSQRAVARCADLFGLVVELRQVSDARMRYPVSGWVSNAAYLRLAIGEAVRDEPRVLYLDADTLVMRDLGPLLHRSLDGAPIGAVRDPQNPVVGTGLALPGCERIGVPRGRDYFNSGVMLLDLAVCAELGVFDLAASLGATVTIDPTGSDPVEAVLDASGGGVETAIEAVGSPTTIVHALTVLAPGGHAVVIGMPPAGADIVVPARLLRHGRTITGTVMGSVRTRADIPRYIDLVLLGLIRTEEMITSRRPLPAVNEAFADTRAHHGIRALITF